MTDSVDPVLSTIEDIFKNVIWDNSIDALLLLAPWTQLPVLRPVISFVSHLLGDALFAVVRKGLDVGVINLKEFAHKEAYESSSIKLRVLALDKGMDSPEYKTARADAKAKFLTLGVFLG